MSVEFFQSVMGKMFYEATMPRIAKALERLASALEKQIPEDSSGRPTFNHSREDGPFAPCDICIKQMSREQLIAYIRDLRSGGRDLKNLLNRAAAALETPGDLTVDDKQDLIMDLTNEAKRADR